uniref:Uncharacterized protein n=1 Tax=Arundo donax TaxID=35708 RepID=A0A0A9DGJ8_ARUDO
MPKPSGSSDCHFRRQKLRIHVSRRNWGLWFRSRRRVGGEIFNTQCALAQRPLDFSKDI